MFLLLSQSVRLSSSKLSSRLWWVKIWSSKNKPDVGCCTSSTVYSRWAGRTRASAISNSRLKGSDRREICRKGASLLHSRWHGGDRARRDCPLRTNRRTRWPAIVESCSRATSKQASLLKVARGSSRARYGNVYLAQHTGGFSEFAHRLFLIWLLKIQTNKI